MKECFNLCIDKIVNQKASEMFYCLVHLEVKIKGVLERYQTSMIVDNFDRGMSTCFSLPAGMIQQELGCPVKMTVSV